MKLVVSRWSTGRPSGTRARVVTGFVGAAVALGAAPALAQTAVAVPVAPAQPPAARVVVAPPGGGGVAIAVPPNAGFAVRPPAVAVPPGPVYVQPQRPVYVQPPGPVYVQPPRPMFVVPPQPPVIIAQPPQYVPPPTYFPPPRDITGRLQFILRRTLQSDPTAANALCPGMVGGLGGINVSGLTYQGSEQAGVANATVAATSAPAPGMPAVVCGGTVQFNYVGQPGMGPWGGRGNLQVYNIAVTGRFAPQQAYVQPQVPVYPQPPTGRFLQMGSVVQGALGPGHMQLPTGAYVDDYQIALTAGVPITIDMQGGPSANYPGSNIDAYVVLMFNGVEVAHDDDSGGNLNARLTVTPSYSGVYTIRATTWGSSSPIGSYTLSVHPAY